MMDDLQLDARKWRFLDNPARYIERETGGLEIEPLIRQFRTAKEILSRLAAGREAVILRGRYIVARRLMALPVIVRASGPGLLFEPIFERRAQELGIDVVGSRPKMPMPLLLRPVLRFLAA